MLAVMRTATANTPTSVAVTAASRARFAAAVARLAAYAEQHGDTRVPAGYRSPDGFALGTWLSNQRRDHRKGALPDRRVRALDALGVDWAPPRGPRPVNAPAARAS